MVFHYDIYSFPSGHVAWLAALAISIISFYPAIGLLLGTATFIVGAVRIVVGIHYVSDVIIGLSMGALVTWGVTVLPLLPMPIP